MSQINITIITPMRPGLKWYDSFKSLGDQEIEEIIVHLRSALAAFHADLADRREPLEEWTLDEYQDMIIKKAKVLKKNGLVKEHERDLSSLDALLASKDEGQTERLRQYLWLISSVVGSSYVLLIVCALGKSRLMKMDEYQRVKLIKFIVSHQEQLFCEELEMEAIERKLDQIRECTACLLCHLLKCRRYASRPPIYAGFDKA